MNILMYIPQPGPTRAPEITANLAKLGNNIVAISPPDRQMLELGVDIKPIRFTTIPFIGPLFLIGGGLISAMAEIIRSKPDAIYTLGGSMGTGILLARVFRCPLITELNGWGRAELKLSSRRGFSKLVSTVSRWMDEREMKCSDYLVVVSTSIKNILQKSLNVDSNKIAVIPNGANIHFFQPISDARKSLDLNQDFHYIGFAGGFNPWHSLEGLIKSAPLILERIPNARFLLVGEGPTRSRISKMVQELHLAEQFIFVGAVPYAEVPKYVNAMDVCVILKRTDIPGSPLKLYEYMACRKPVVVTDDSDFDIVREVNAGVLVDPENPVEIANAIIGLLQDSELRQQMGNNGIKYVVEHRSWEMVATEVEEVISDISSKS